MAAVFASQVYFRFYTDNPRWTVDAWVLEKENMLVTQDFGFFFI